MDGVPPGRFRYRRVGNRLESVPERADGRGWLGRRWDRFFGSLNVDGSAWELVILLGLIGLLSAFLLLTK